MIGSELIDNVWRDCGEPTDIDPATAGGLAFFTAALNRGLEAVASWKGYQGRRMSMFPDYIEHVFVQNKREDQTVDSSDADWDVIEVDEFPSTFTLQAGDFVEVDGEVRLIWNISATELYLSSAFSAEPDGKTATFIQALLDPEVDRVVAYLRVENVQSQEDLPRTSKRMSNVDNLETSEEPSSWSRYQGVIAFDVVPDDVYLWRVWYYRLPTLMLTTDYALDTECDMPDDFQHAVELHMMQQVYRHMQEPEAAVEAFRAFDNALKITVGSWQRENMLHGGGSMKVRMA